MFCSALRTGVAATNRSQIDQAPFLLARANKATLFYYYSIFESSYFAVFRKHRSLLFFSPVREGYRRVSRALRAPCCLPQQPGWHRGELRGGHSATAHRGWVSRWGEAANKRCVRTGANGKLKCTFGRVRFPKENTPGNCLKPVCRRCWGAWASGRLGRVSGGRVQGLQAG